MSDRNSPEYWELRAEEARAIAEQMHHPECRKSMFEVAVGYGLMAETARRLRKYEPMAPERKCTADREALGVKSTLA